MQVGREILRDLKERFSLKKQEVKSKQAILPGTDRCVLLDEFRESGWSNAILYTPDDLLSRFQVIRCAKLRGQHYFVESHSCQSPEYVPIEKAFTDNPLLRSQLLVFGVNISVGRGTGFLSEMNKIVQQTLTRVGYGSLLIESSHSHI